MERAVWAEALPTEGEAVSRMRTRVALMPVEDHRCERCLQKRDVCPDCGSPHVTRRENMYAPSPNEVVDYGVDDEKVEYKHVCWDCGWDETVVMTIERK